MGDIEIARNAKLKDIRDVAKELKATESIKQKLQKKLLRKIKIKRMEN